VGPLRRLQRGVDPVARANGLAVVQQLKKPETPEILTGDRAAGQQRILERAQPRAADAPADRMNHRSSGGRVTHG
jgi:hypothetical protein